MKRFIPHIAKHGSLKEQAQFVVLGLASIYEGLVFVLSLGFLSVDIRSWLLIRSF